MSLTKELASSVGLLFISYQKTFRSEADLEAAVRVGALSFAWDAARGCLIMNFQTQKLANRLMWDYLDPEWMAAGRELDLELLEIHAMDTGVTYDLGRELMNDICAES